MNIKLVLCGTVWGQVMATEQFNKYISSAHSAPSSDLVFTGSSATVADHVVLRGPYQLIKGTYKYICTLLSPSVLSSYLPQTALGYNAAAEVGQDLDFQRPVELSYTSLILHHYWFRYILKARWPFIYVSTLTAKAKVAGRHSDGPRVQRTAYTFVIKQHQMDALGNVTGYDCHCMVI